MKRNSIRAPKKPKKPRKKRASQAYIQGKLYISVEQRVKKRVWLVGVRDSADHSLTALNNRKVAAFFWNWVNNHLIHFPDCTINRWLNDDNGDPMEVIVQRQFTL